MDITTLALAKAYTDEEIKKVDTGEVDLSEYAKLKDIQNAINEALAQAKESGEFKGDPGAKGEPGEPGEPGQDYILTEEDRQEIINNIINGLPEWQEGTY